MTTIFIPTNHLMRSNSLGSILVTNQLPEPFFRIPFRAKKSCSILRAKNGIRSYRHVPSTVSGLFPVTRNRMDTPVFLKSDVDVTRWTSFSTPARSRYVCELLSSDDAKSLPDVFAFADSLDLPILFVGSGTNLLFAFNEYPGILVRSKVK